MNVIRRITNKNSDSDSHIQFYKCTRTALELLNSGRSLLISFQCCSFTRMDTRMLLIIINNNNNDKYCDTQEVRYK